MGRVKQAKLKATACMKSPLSLAPHAAICSLNPGFIYSYESRMCAKLTDEANRNDLQGMCSQYMVYIKHTQS